MEKCWNIFGLLILTLFLALIIPKEYKAQIWTILVFDVIAFLSVKELITLYLFSSLVID